MSNLMLTCSGCGQPTQVKDVVQDQRNKEHDWRQEDSTKPEDEWQDERGEPAGQYLLLVIETTRIPVELCISQYQSLYNGQFLWIQAPWSGHKRVGEDWQGCIGLHSPRWQIFISPLGWRGGGEGTKKKILVREDLIKMFLNWILSKTDVTLKITPNKRKKFKWFKISILRSICHDSVRRTISI